MVKWKAEREVGHMELWSKEHITTLLPAVAVMIVLAALLGKWLKEKPEPIRRLPLQIIAVILLILFDELIQLKMEREMKR